MSWDEALHNLRLVVARLVRYYRQPFSEVLEMDLVELTEWADILPEVEPKP